MNGLTIKIFWSPHNVEHCMWLGFGKLVLFPKIENLIFLLQTQTFMNALSNFTEKSGLLLLISFFQVSAEPYAVWGIDRTLAKCMWLYSFVALFVLQMFFHYSQLNSEWPITCLIHSNTLLFHFNDLFPSFLSPILELTWYSYPQF